MKKIGRDVLIQSLSLGAAIGLTALVGACGSSSDLDKNPEVSRGMAMSSTEDMPVPTAGQAVNKQFASLDDYLAWLRKMQAPVDGPWYEEISPGVYQLRTGNLRILGAEGEVSPGVQTLTRAQLMKRFGFKN